MPSSTASALTSSSPRFLWNEIVRWTFEACILRKEGREDGVAPLLQERLPALIRAWSTRCGLAPDTCREQLRCLFVRVQEQVELGFIQRRLIVDEICSRMGSRPAVRAAAAPMGLRRRIPFDDVPGMLDALAEAEIEAQGEAVLPVRSALAPMVSLNFAAEPAGRVALSA